MTSLSINQVNSEGFQGIHVVNGIIELTLIPELGGKISSLRDMRTGREWLWRHPRFAYKRVPHGSSYVNEADTGGWDECFPSVSACAYPSIPWKNAAIQDHGELWSQDSKFDIEEQANTVILRSEWQGVVLPYIFTRDITLTMDSGKIHVEYYIKNASENPINFVWCIHPLLAIEQGMELRLPATARFNVAGAYPSTLVPLEQKLQYPFEASGLNFPLLPSVSAKRSIKIWSDPLSLGDGWASLHAKNGEFQMRWDVKLLPQIAAWMNFGAWAADGGTPYFNLGLEPCIGAQDSLADAVNQYNLYSTVLPNDSKTWWLEIELIA